MLWFIAYFLVSNLNKNELNKFDFAFDIIQSVASFSAAFALGIAVHDEGYSFDRSSKAFDFANGAILAICAFSLLFFSRPATWSKNKELDVLRLIGALLAIDGLMVARNDPLTCRQLATLAGTLLGLVVLLLRFGRIRINELPGT
jgi:hypothetical protein